MGKEGPMIHSGAVVGAGLPQVRVMGWEGESLTVVSGQGLLGVSLEENPSAAP